MLPSTTRLRRLRLAGSSYEYSGDEWSETGYEPSAQLVIDSTKFTTETKARLTALEDVLFGTENVEPRLPLPNEVISMLGGSGTTGTTGTTGN